MLLFVEVVLLVLKVIFFMLQVGGELATGTGSSGGSRSIHVPLL